jgi:hypothetical protein
MTIRKEKHIEGFIEQVDRQWKLSINEEDFLDSVFNLILQGETNKVANIVNLYYEGNYEELLELIPNSDIEYYAQKSLGLIDDWDCDCKEQKTLEDSDDDEIKEEYFDRFKEYRNGNIVSDLNFDEMSNLFLSLTPQKQLEIIESLKTL